MKTRWTFNELEAYIHEPLHVTGELSLEDELKKRSKMIYSATPVKFDGYFFADLEDEEYTLSATIQSDMVLASSRSLDPVDFPLEIQITEIYLPPHQRQRLDEFDDEVVLVQEDEQVDLKEVVVESILASIPIQILTPEEKTSNEMPKGDHWEIISEDDVEARRKERLETDGDPRFDVLKSLFDENQETDSNDED